MKFILFVLFLLVVNFSEQKIDDDGVTWAVLIAGANTWSNYWSEAQVYAAYQQLHQAGIPDERIIVWHYDDIANNRANPTPGKIYLYKGGPEVYHDVPKDLTGSKVNPNNFVDLLHGKVVEGGSGKSLKSTDKDRVFLYFSDHGGPGAIYFPGFQPFHVQTFMDALKYMHDNKMYKEMVIYLDTCESGSMFNGHLAEDMNIYAVTSSDPGHVAWLCDCRWIDDDGHVNDFPCTSNCWAKYWIQDALWSMGNGTFSKRTIQEQYIECRDHTYHDECYNWPNCQQQSCQYGDLSIAENVLNMFEGPGVQTQIGEVESIPPSVGPDRNMGILGTNKVPIPLNKWLLLKKRSMISNSLQDQKNLIEYEKHMSEVDKRWSLFARAANLEEKNKDIYECHPREVVDLECMKTSIESAIKHCGNFDEYSAQFTSHLKLACLQNVENVDELLKSIC